MEMSRISLSVNLQLLNNKIDYDKPYDSYNK